MLLNFFIRHVKFLSQVFTLSNLTVLQRKSVDKISVKIFQESQKVKYIKVSTNENSYLFILGRTHLRTNGYTLTDSQSESVLIYTDRFSLVLIKTIFPVSPVTPSLDSETEVRPLHLPCHRTSFYPFYTLLTKKRRDKIKKHSSMTVFVDSFHFRYHTSK